MWSERDRAQLQADRDAHAAWWAGDRSRPLILPRRTAYDVCAVLLPTITSRVRLILRIIVATVARWIPISTVKTFIYRRLGVRIGRDVFISPGALLDPCYPELIELNDGCFLGAECRLVTHEYTASNFRIGRVRVGAGSVIGAFSVIRSSVSVGRAVTTGLGSVVMSDVPDGRSVVGNPARRLPLNQEAD